MLLGEYRTKLGEKNRTAVPKKFRDEIGSRCIVTQGYERCLVLVSLKQWEDLLQGFDTLPFTNNTLRDTARFLIGGAVEIEMDSQGRFVLPQNLREYARMSEEIVFLGLNRWAEIWGREAWSERKEYLFENSALIAQKLHEIQQ